MKLSFQQKEEIYTRGYTKVANVIPKIMIDEALKTINKSVGQAMNAKEMTELELHSFRRHTEDKAILDLLHQTPAWDLAQSALGEGMIHPNQNAQIALRYPISNDPAPKATPHLDGMNETDRILNFTMLIGVLLSDLPHVDSGNFTVWPGTHRLTEQYFQEHGADSLLDYAGRSAHFLKEKIGQQMPEPEQVTGKAGDIIISHFQLAHGIGPNISPHIRYAVFFRLDQKNHRKVHTWQEPMENIWLHWPGMKDILVEKGM